MLCGSVWREWQEGYVRPRGVTKRGGAPRHNRQATCKLSVYVLPVTNPLTSLEPALRCALQSTPPRERLADVFSCCALQSLPRNLPAYLAAVLRCQRGGRRGARPWTVLAIRTQVARAQDTYLLYLPTLPTASRPLQLRTKVQGARCRAERTPPAQT